MNGAAESQPGTVTPATSQPGESPGQSPRAESRLVLSLFPGAGLLDRGFEQAGFCVVRGPDTLLGQRIEDFAAACHAFAGIIGGPPCQDFSRARRCPPVGHGLRMIEQFVRVVTEAQPDWFLMENVPGVPDIHVEGYRVQRFNILANEFGVRQRRNRAFQFGSRDGIPLVLRRSESQDKIRPAVLAGDTHRNFADLCELQGLPRWFNMPGMSRGAKIRAVGNGVPVPVAAALAQCIRHRSISHGLRLCVCGCGRPVTGKQISATPACRKRIERARRLTPLPP